MGKNRGEKLKALLKNNLMSLVLFFSVILAVGVIAGDVIEKDGQLTLEEDFIVNTDKLNPKQTVNFIMKKLSK